MLAAMKRLSYVSRCARTLSAADIDAIAMVSQRNNQRDGVTGILVVTGGVFIQTLEGDDQAVDATYRRILADDRHLDVICLQSEAGITRRIFADWSLDVIDLDRRQELVLQPLRVLLQTLTASYRIIERYTQPAVFRLLAQGLNPLRVAPRKVERIVLFSDIVSFSAFAETLPVEGVLALANHFLDTASRRIAAAGGEVTKFIGDAVLAYFPVERGEDAVRASVALLADLRDSRALADESSPLRLLHAGVGLARGWVIEGNLGTGSKMDWTIIGDAVNTAARVEAATRGLGHALAFDSGVRATLGASLPCLPLGDRPLKGKRGPVELHTLEHEAVRKTADEVGFETRIRRQAVRRDA